MSRPHSRQRMPRLLGSVIAVTLAAPVGAGTFIDFNQNNAAIVTHPSGYTGVAGQVTVGICLDPNALPMSGDPTQAMRNVAATYNRLEAKLGNLVNNNAGKVDFESVLLHEVGHCLGMDHVTLGPSEIGTGDFSNPQLYFANAFKGANASFDTTIGADAIRATRDDARGDDVNRNWFRKNVNNPWEIPPATVDRGTHSVLKSDLPVGYDFTEVATSFGPCNGSQPNSSSTNGQLPTQNTMFPVLCTNKFLRELAPDDVTTLRLARAGRDGSQAGAADNYTTRVEVVPPGPGCKITVKFVNDAGFAFCQVGGQFLAPDIVITTAEARFQRTVDWHFNATDTTGEGGGMPSANLSIGMQASTANAMPGETVTYTLNIANAGPATATATTVTNPTPAGLTFVSNTGSCVSAFPCVLGDLALNATRQIVSTWRIADDQAGGGVITTTATVMSGATDSVLGNNSAMQSLTVWAPQADLSLAISDGGGPAMPGGNVTYTAAVSNAGPSNANTVQLNLTLPVGTVFSSASGSGWTCGNQGNVSVQCTRSSLAAGTSRNVSVVVTVPANYAGPSTLQISGVLSSTTLDPLSGVNNSNPASDTTPLVQASADFVYCSGFEDATCVH
jgi:uncharacterized repeat protein (TIGR01451 family)